jgi:hypothetical protein
MSNIVRSVTVERNYRRLLAFEPKPTLADEEKLAC